VAKVKPLSTWEAENRLHDRSAGLFKPPICCRQIDCKKDHQRSANTVRDAFYEAARQTPIAELAIGGAVLLEIPSKRLAIEVASSVDSMYHQFDVVDPAIIVRRPHVSLRCLG